MVLADKGARLPGVLRKTSVARGLGVEKHVFCVAAKKGIGSDKCGVREGDDRKGMRDRDEGPGARVKEIEFEIPKFSKTRRASAAFW